MENTTPLVSVLMPVHNAEKHLEDSINSVLNQTYSNFELIVLDDCSTDRTLRIVESIARLDQRIVVLKNGNNFGIAASRNKLMQAAKGELFFNMDSDDICHKERLYKQVMFLNQNPNIMVLGSYYSHIGVSSKIIQVPTTPLEIKALLSIKNCICNSSAAFRAELFKKHNYTLNENLLVSSDYDYWCHISQKFDIANLPEVLLYYRKHEVQISETKLQLQRQNHLQIISSRIENPLRADIIWNLNWQRQSLTSGDLKTFCVYVNEIERSYGVSVLNSLDIVLRGCCKFKGLTGLFIYVRFRRLRRLFRKQLGLPFMISCLKNI